MTNEARMTLEEKLVQRIKDDTLMAAVGDEDMLTDLVKRALHEALFQKRKVSDGYNRSHEEPSLVVQEATTIARDAIEKVSEGMFQKAIENEDVKAAIEKAMPHMMMDAFRSAVDVRVHTAIAAARDEAILHLQSTLSAKGIYLD